MVKWFESSQSSNEIKQARKIQEKAENLGLKVSKMLAKEREQSANQIPPPVQSEDLVADATQDLRTSLNDHGLLEKRGRKFLGRDAKKTIAENTASDLMSRGEARAIEI